MARKGMCRRPLDYERRIRGSSGSGSASQHRRADDALRHRTSCPPSTLCLPPAGDQAPPVGVPPKRQAKITCRNTARARQEWDDGVEEGQWRCSPCGEFENSSPRQAGEAQPQRSRHRIFRTGVGGSLKPVKTPNILSSKRVRALESWLGCNNLREIHRSPDLRSGHIAWKAVQTRGH